MAKCPNLSNETVREEFNKILARLKGKALPADYVVNPRDYHGGLTQNEQAAYDMAYSLWDDHANTGAIHNFLDAFERVKAAANTSDTERARAAATRNDGYHINKQAMNNTGVKDFPDTPITSSTEVPRAIADKLFEGNPPDEVGAAAAAADYFSHRFRAFWDMRTVTDANPHIEPLQRVDRLWKAKDRFAAKISLDANDVANSLNRLSKERKDRLYNFIDHYMNRRFIPDEELKKGVDRLPTKAELDKMVKDFKMESQELTLFTRMAKEFRQFANQTVDVMKEQIDLAGLDPKQHAKELAALEEMRKNWLNKPYFPAMRYGDYTLLIDGPEGRRFYRFESERAQKKALKAAMLSKRPDETVEAGKLPLSRSGAPFQGLPHALLDMIEKRLKLSPEQLKAIQQLKFEVAPIQSFAHRFQKQQLIPGYSRDFQRSFSNYFFNGSRYLANIKYMSEIDRAVTDLEQSARGVPDGTKRAEIANFVRNTVNMARDSRSDWAIPRAFAFHYFLGFRPASAFTNLTQTVLSTYPHLAAVAGDATALRAMTKATADFQNFYKHEKIMKMNSPEMRALNELVHEGVVKGALASELAGHAEARNLELGYGPNKVLAGVQQFMKASASLFELAEQTNRRIAGMAMYDIAMRRPDLKFVRETVRLDPTRYAELLTKGFNDREASAIMSASRMIERTQFAYERFYRPAYQRGLGSLTMIFRLFQHRMLWNMWNYPAAGARTMLMFAALGGLAGIPFLPDINNVIKLAGWWMGKDWDVMDEARKFAVNVLNMKDKNEWDDPYLITNGLASHGFGIPFLLDYLGEWSGVGKFSPRPDLSRAVAMSNVLIDDPYALAGPAAEQNPASAFAQGVANGAGPLGSFAYNLFQALNNTKTEGIRRWEKVMPVAAASIAHTYRQYTEGGETRPGGGMLVRMDPHNPHEMADILFTAGGFTTARVNKAWSEEMAKREATTFWDMRRQLLLNHYWTAFRSKDPVEIDRVKNAIRNFNKEVSDTPELRPQAITSEVIQRSMQMRERSQAKGEMGLPQAKRNIPLTKSIHEMFPGSEVETRRVR